MYHLRTLFSVLVPKSKSGGVLGQDSPPFLAERLPGCRAAAVGRHSSFPALTGAQSNRNCCNAEELKTALSYSHALALLFFRS